jgi:glycosyltransferase involved in cell wall biosynthesis
MIPATDQRSVDRPVEGPRTSTVAFIAHGLGRPDGGSRAGVDILASLLTSGNRVLVVSQDRVALPTEVAGRSIAAPTWLEPPRATPAPAGLTRDAPLQLARWLRDGVTDVGRRAVLRQRLATTPPHLTIVNGFPKPAAPATALYDRARRRAMVVHSSPEAIRFFERATPGMHASFVASKLRQADGLVFVADAVRDAWVARADLDPERTVTIHNCVDDARVATAEASDPADVRRAIGVPPEAFAIVCVGTVDRRKGQSILIDAVRNLSSHDRPVHLLLVGLADSDEAHRLRALVSASGLDGSVRFLGVRSDAVEIVRAADLLVLPSYAEALSLSVLEAMAVGTPAIATEVGGTAELIDDGVSGITVPPGDADALEQAIATLHRDPDLSERLAIEGRTRFQRDFARSLHAERYRTWLARQLQLASD